MWGKDSDAGLDGTVCIESTRAAPSLKRKWKSVILLSGPICTPYKLSTISDSAQKTRNVIQSNLTGLPGLLETPTVTTACTHTRSPQLTTRQSFTPPSITSQHPRHKTHLKSLHTRMIPPKNRTNPFPNLQASLHLPPSPRLPLNLPPKPLPRLDIMSIPLGGILPIIRINRIPPCQLATNDERPRPWAQ